MLCLHFVVLEGLVELFILRALLLLFKSFYFDLLFENSAFDIGHVMVCLEHFGQEVVRARDRDPRLHQELHAFHYICSCGIIESNLTLDVVVYLKLVWDINKLFTINSHMFCEGHLALLADQSL